MKEIYLTDEQYRNLPYKTTTITRAKTYGEIIGLLETHGIKDYQWTRYQDTDQLAFPIKIKRDDVEAGFLVKLTVPRLMYAKRQGRGKHASKKLIYLENVSWRIFWWHLKSRLEAIQYGVSDEVQEFMYHINYQLPDGGEVNIGQALTENLQNLNKLTALEDRRVIREAEAQ